MSGADVFKLYANCLPVRGARRSLLCDLQTQRAQFIPNDLFDLLTEMDGLPVAEIKRQFESSEAAVIDAYFAMLVEQEFGFWCDEPERFPPLDLHWDRPEAITNAIIDVDDRSRHDYPAIFSQLDGLGCRAVEVRAFDALSLAAVIAILEACEPTRLRHLDLVLKFQPELTRETLGDLCLRYQVISRVLVHSSPYAMKVTLEPLPILLRFDPHEVAPLSCGEVAPDYFSLTVDHFTEALHFNTCLNRKLSIAADGEIKSCPVMPHSLGNVRDTQLAAAARHPVLVQLGRITKDQIDVCRDCEFRYICTDCRAFTREAGNLYSKPAKCAYDPYTATWAEASPAH
jgi:SPASM domain peptide maturase of grasp-with-spasm system